MAALDLGLVAVLVIAAVFIVWFIAGSVWNRRLARRLANELRDSLLALGGRSTVQTYGTTAFRMTTEGANPPFRDLSVVVTLQPREMPINWAIGVSQGRRDAAVLEASLRRTPRIGFELVDPKSRVGRRRMRTKSSWTPTTLGGRDVLLSAKNEADVEKVLASLDPGVLRNISALHVTAGTEPGIAISLTLREDEVSPTMLGIRTLAEALTA